MLAELPSALVDHVEEAESPDGLLAAIVTDAPWLEPRARGLQREHELLLRDCEELRRRDSTTVSPARWRDDIRRFTRRLEAHHHRGTALLMDAYELDLSAGD